MNINLMIARDLTEGLKRLTDKREIEMSKAMIFDLTRKGFEQLEKEKGGDLK